MSWQLHEVSSKVAGSYIVTYGGAGSYMKRVARWQAVILANVQNVLNSVIAVNVS